MSYRDKAYKYVMVKVEGGIARITNNRPKALNAVNLEMMREQKEVYAGIAADPEVKVLITTGNDRAYCAGGDLKLFANFSVKEAREFIDEVIDMASLVYNMGKPTIAMIAGICVGGGLESALNHDFRIAADNAVFALPEINVGIYPGGGATQRLPQLIPLSKAKELVFLGETFDAQAALDWGIVNRVAPLADLEKETMEIAVKLLQKPAFSLRLAKESLNAAWSCSVEKGLQLETHGWAMCYGTYDQREGMAAFIEKRSPVFKGE